MAPFPVTPADPQIYTLLAGEGFGDDLFNPRQHRSCELVDHYVLQTVIEVVGRLGVAEPLRSPRTLEELREAGGFVADFRRPLGWLVERLVLAGLAVREGDRYRLPAPLPATERERLHQEAMALDAAYGPAYALVDEAAAAYPRVARGETTGERALFQKPALWVAYFSNANAYYALNNHVTARVAARRLPGRDARILELGAGLGSATDTLLDLVGPGRIARYRATEPVAFFRRRAERTVREAHPSVALVSASLDINRPWAAQDVEPGAWDLVWAVNVLHLARNLEMTLGEASTALAAGGWLVVGEGLRPVAGQPVGAEFAFQLLESFLDVETDAGTRRTPGFLTAEEWLGALARAGFAEPAVVPDAVRLRAVHRGFFTAAVCGRRAGN